jgi:hypothetical protein
MFGRSMKGRGKSRAGTVARTVFGAAARLTARMDGKDQHGGNGVQRAPGAAARETGK